MKRVLGRWDLTGLMINATIGAGILGLPGRLYALVGPWCLVVCMAGAALMACVGAVFALAGSRFRRTGGAYLFVREAFGGTAGILTGWLAVVTALLSYATIANLVLTYAAAFLPGIDHGPARIAALAVMTLLLEWPIYCGVRLSSATHTAFTLVKLSLLTGFAVLALPASLRHGIAPAPLPPLRNWSPALITALFALLGLEATTVSNGEMRRPERDLPVALGLGVIVVAALYCGVLAASMAVVPELAHSVRPVYDGMRILAGPAGAAFAAGAGTLSMCGVLFVILFNGPRIMFALARNSQLPAVLAQLHPAFQTPHRAVALHGTLAFLLAISFSLFGALKAATLTRLLLYGATALSVIVLDRRGFSETQSPLHLCGGRGLCWFVAILCGGLIFQSKPQEIASFAICLLPGFVFAFFVRQNGRPARQDRPGISY